MVNKLSDNIEDYPEFYYIIGAIEGDGSLDKKLYRIKLNVIDFDFIYKIIEIMNNLSPNTKIHTYPKKVRGNRKPQLEFHMNCKAFFNRQLYNLKPKTEKEICFYLKGLFDAEGCIYFNPKIRRKRLIISQKDTKKLDYCFYLLNKIGIKLNKEYRPGNRSELNTRKLEEIIKFNNKIGFFIKRKQEKLENTIDFFTKPKLNSI